MGRAPPAIRESSERVAYVACRTFLKLNGHDPEASQEEKYATFLALAAGRLSEAELAAWIRGHLSVASAAVDRTRGPAAP